MKLNYSQNTYKCYSSNYKTINWTLYIDYSYEIVVSMRNKCSINMYQ